MDILGLISAQKFGILLYIREKFTIKLYILYKEVKLNKVVLSILTN